MPKPYRGGCLCGAVRYQIDAEPALAGYCQCRDCQRESGGGHTCFVGFPIASVTVTGTLRFHEVIADSGRGIRRGFCPTCGSPVLGAPDEAFGLLMIRAGSLDDPASSGPSSSATRAGPSPGTCSIRRCPVMPSCPRTNRGATDLRDWRVEQGAGA